MKRHILKILLTLWILVWVFFTVRELFIKDGISAYRELLSRDLRGKHSFVEGERLYDLLSFANRSLPQGASYKLRGLDDGSIEKRRATYYLYPHLEKEDAEYEIVYCSSVMSKELYQEIQTLDADRYILKRVK